MAATQVSAVQKRRLSAFWSANLFQNQGVLVFVVLIVVFLVGSLVFGSTFYSSYNITTMLVFNSMFAFISLGMTFVIMTGGIDLSVSSVAVLTSMLAAWFSRFGLLPAIFVPVLVGVLIGLFNGWSVAKLGILPFIATLVTFMGARGLALIMPKIYGIYLNNLFPNVPWSWTDNVADYSIGIDRSQNFQAILGNFLGLPIPVWLIIIAYFIGAILLQYTRFGRVTLSIGDNNEEAARLMGLPVTTTKLLVYAMSGGLAGLAGVILASRSGTALPTEAVGWELQAISAVVVGGTLLTGGKGSVVSTLIGVLLLGLIFNMLNFINVGGFSLTVYWQAVVRGTFLFVVVLLQSSWLRRNR